VLYPYGELNFMALLPCPLRVAFEKTATLRTREFEEKTGQHVKALFVSGMDKAILAELNAIDSMENWPDVIMIPGFDMAFNERFKKRFRDTGCFRSIMPQNNPMYLQNGIYDPQGYYDVIGVSTIVFVSDHTYRDDYSDPESWTQLVTDPQYHRRVGMVGHEWAGFQDNGRLSVYWLGGEDMVVGLAKTAKCCLLGAEMVRLSASRRAVAPDIYVLGYNFARAAIKNDRMRMIWPAEGAAAMPLMLLTKKGASETSVALARHLICEETASVLRMGGFYASVDPKPFENNTVVWPDWEFLKRTDMPLLSEHLNRIMIQNSDIIRTRPVPGRIKACKS
jgi:ABC-type Fe3+ transport system substrate-binding protein